MNILRTSAGASLLAFIALSICAQTPATQVAFKKDKPVQITYFSSVYTSRDAPWFQKKLDQKAGFTVSEAAIIMSRIGAGGAKPEGFSKFENNASVLSHYKAYQQFYFSRLGYHYVIVWLPFEENQHMPDGLRPTEKEGCLFLINGRGISADGKDAAGAALAIAGTPVPAAEMAPQSSSTATSGTTPSGVQYSTADMSEFGPSLLGCMAIYPSNGASSMYIVSVYGNALGDKAVVADEAYKVTGLADSRHTYQWFPGENATTLQQRYKRSIMNVQISGKYTIR